MNSSFGITSEDIETVLSKNRDRIVNMRGLSFDSMGEKLLDDVDHDSIVSAALDGGIDINDRTHAAHSEIESQLVDLGVLIPKKAAPHTKLG